MSILLMAILLNSCSNDDGGTAQDEPFVGKWKQISETENGIDQILTSCDLQEVTEVKSNGDFTVEDFDLVNGECVLNDPNEPGLTVTSKWEKIATNSYRVNFYANGQLALSLDFATEFSNNNNTMKTTATEPDGDLVVSVLNRI